MQETDPELKESDIWVFNCNGSLYFVRAKSDVEALEKFRIAQSVDGVPTPIEGIGHKIKLWE
jgi:hypothetical protein